MSTIGHPLVRLFVAIVADPVLAETRVFAKHIVVAGRILFEMKVGDELTSREMGPGDAVHVTPPTVHRMTALEDSDIFEVSTPEVDDVVRLEDRYGRKT